MTDNQDNIINFFNKKTEQTTASEAIIKIKNQQGSIKLEFRGANVALETEKILTLCLQSSFNHQKFSAE